MPAQSLINLTIIKAPIHLILIDHNIYHHIQHSFINSHVPRLKLSNNRRNQISVDIIICEYKNNQPMSFCNFFCCETPLKQNELESISDVQVRMFDSLPMKIKDSNYPQHNTRSQKQKVLFTDAEFPPNNNALGQFLHIQRKLVWKRIPQIVKDPCIYSPDKHPADSIMAVTSSGSHMKAALISLAFRPQRIFSIFGDVHEANPSGIYQLKVKIKGILQWIVVDDYVPVFVDTGRPLLCGTVGHQIWIMLIFKTYAKICGSYSQIQSQDSFSVLNTFTPGPCFSYLLDPSLREDKDAIQQIFLSLECPSNAICVTTNKNPKFGLRGEYNYSVRSFSKGFVQLIGLGQNQQLGFKLSFDDILENCSEMAVSTNDRNCINSQEVKLTVQYNVPFFLTYNLEESYQLILNFWKEEDKDEQTFMRVVICRQQQNHRYTYVASKLQAYYSQMAVSCPQMKAGTYKIMIIIKGTKQKSANINFVCYRKMRGQFALINFKQSKQSQETYQLFLSSALEDFSKNDDRKIIRELPSSGSALQIHELYRKGGLGYVIVAAGSRKKLKHLLVKIDKKQIENSHYELLEPLGNDLIVMPNTSVGITFLLKSLPLKFGQAIQFPPGISIMEVF